MKMQVNEQARGPAPTFRMAGWQDGRKGRRKALSPLLPADSYPAILQCDHSTQSLTVVRADVVDHAVDAFDLVDDARGDRRDSSCGSLAQSAVIRPALDRADCDGVFVGPLVSHHADALCWKKDREALPQLGVATPPSSPSDTIASAFCSSAMRGR